MKHLKHSSINIIRYQYKAISNHHRLNCNELNNYSLKTIFELTLMNDLDYDNIAIKKMIQTDIEIVQRLLKTQLFIFQH